MIRVGLKMLMNDRVKYYGIIFGIAFASFLMTQQMAFFVGLMVRTYSVITDISSPDVWVLDPRARQLDSVRNMSDRELYRVRSVPGVSWAVPLLKGIAQVRLPDGSYELCSVMGLDDQTLIGGPPALFDGRKMADLRQADAVFVDQANAQVRLNDLHAGQYIEINENRAKVIGRCDITQSFQFIPTIYTTYSRASLWLPQQRNQLTFVLVKAAAGVTPAELARRIAAQTGLAAYTRDNLAYVTLMFYMEQTGIPVIFGTTVVLGFIVGIAVAGQMFFQFMSENQRSFAVLKAMGMTNKGVVGIVLMQALVVGLIGYGLGVGMTGVFEPLLTLWVPKNAMSMLVTWHILAIGGLGVLVIVLASSSLAVSKVLRLEPGMVFK